MPDHEPNRIRSWVSVAIVMLLQGVSAAAAVEQTSGSLAPVALAAREGDRNLFIACAAAGRVLRFDTGTGKLTGSVAVSQPPSGMALSKDGTCLFITSSGAEGTIFVLDAARMAVVRCVPAGHMPAAPLLSPHEQSLFVCNRFSGEISVFNLPALQHTGGFAVPPEPVACAATRDGKRLLVAHLRPHQRADGPYLAAPLSVFDTTSGDLIRELHLPNGSGAVAAMKASPDGKYAAVVHNVAQFGLPTVHLSVRWMNAAALTMVDLGKMEILGSVLLDDRGKGAANPSDLAWSGDGSLLVITHAGTHELSIIPFAGLLEKILDLPAPLDFGNPRALADLAPYAIQMSSYLPFFPAPRERVKLPPGDLGPRAIAVVGWRAYVANYFSDTLTVLDLRNPRATMHSVPLGAKSAMPLARKGEMYFHDSTICYQGWQSCASCHPDEARADGFNWDLLNDGTGNSKNTRSLLFAHRTPPAMTLGVRETAETAVRSGIEHILFTKQPEYVAVAIDEYLKSLSPLASPHLAKGQLRPLAAEGKKVFERAGCAVCHPPPLFTDQKRHDVGTRNASDKPDDEFDTPTLVEMYRTGPYLHDGSAVTARDVITTRNPNDRHGRTLGLSSAEIEALAAYLLSL